MNYILLAVKDTAVQAFQAINTVRARGEAVRGFMDAINNPDNRQLHAHPEDYELYIVGTYNDETGEISACKPELLMRGIDAKRSLS